ncbi:MAG: hypothetical protein ACHQEM_13320 [Chitinophagales bacterium]
MKNNLQVPNKETLRIYYTLRVAVAMCFIGHGAFGIITKPIWYNYFAVFGIGHDLAKNLMPLVGSMDVLLGICMIIYPIRIITFWLIFWGAVTASLRPMSGEPFAEFIERAGNFGAPLALLLITGGFPKTFRELFLKIDAPVNLTERNWLQLTGCLRVVIFLLLAGHGWLNLIEKKSLMNQYASIGIGSPDLAAYSVGIVEIIAACSVLIRPIRPILFVLFIWKMGSELFYPKHELFEWVERGGSYGTLLALWFATEVSNELVIKRWKWAPLEAKR